MAFSIDPQRRTIGQPIGGIELGGIAAADTDDLPAEGGSKTELLSGNGDRLQAPIDDVSIEHPVTLDAGRLETSKGAMRRRLDSTGPSKPSPPSGRGRPGHQGQRPRIRDRRAAHRNRAGLPDRRPRLAGRRWALASGSWPPPTARSLARRSRTRLLEVVRRTGRARSGGSRSRRPRRRPTSGLR